MWLMSNSPAAVRTAWCSSTMLVYCTGMSQPAKSTMRRAVGDVPVVQRGAESFSHGNTS